MDNTTNNDTMTCSIKQHCLAKGIPFDTDQACLCCMPHTVHLAALDVSWNVSFWNLLTESFLASWWPQSIRQWWIQHKRRWHLSRLSDCASGTRIWQRGWVVWWASWSHWALWLRKWHWWGNGKGGVGFWWLLFWLAQHICFSFVKSFVLFVLVHSVAISGKVKSALFIWSHQRLS